MDSPRKGKAHETKRLASDHHSGDHDCAYAVPFDHSWIPGIHDEGDFGVVVALVTDAASSVDTTPLEERSPEPVVFELPGRFPTRFR